MIKKIALVVVALISAWLIYAATKPDSFRVERSVLVNAPPEKIFPLVNDLRSWESWSPYEKKDPGMKRNFSGPISGQGAKYAWEGNRDIGQGSMEIIVSEPPAKILLDLHFIKPFEGRNTAEFRFEPQGGATKVSWAMYGPSPYLSKLMDTIFNLDKMIGGDFAAGLANLKAAAEK